VQDVAEILVPGAIATMFPDLEGYTPEISGFGWFQGWNDGCSLNDTAAYEPNLVNLIHDVRKAWNKPQLPISVAVSGFGGWLGQGAVHSPPDCWSKGDKLHCSCPADRGCRRTDIILSQFAGTNSSLHPDIGGHAVAMETRDYWREAQYSPNRAQGYHFFHNAETYFLIGKQMAQGMLQAAQT